MSEFDIDIKEKVKSSLKRYFPNKDWRDEDIMLDVLKMKASNVEWSNITHNVQEGINSTVTVERNANTPNYAQGAPQVNTVNDSNVIGRVTLERVIKGLNKMLTLPLNGKAHKFNSILGNSVNIHIGRSVTDLKMDKVKIAVSVETGGHTASATIRTLKTIYKGNFECDVELRGNVIIDNQDGGVLQQDIVSMLGSGTIHVTGKIEFLWDNEQNFNMTG